MPNDYKAKIARIRSAIDGLTSRLESEIYSKEKEVLDIYFETIRELYPSLPKGYQQRLLDGLDKIIDGAQKWKDRNSKRSPAFDSQRAKEIRESTALSIGKLASQLDPANKEKLARAIYRYEHGTSTPTNPPKGPHIRAYLQWLKENDYNPYTIK